MRILLPRRLALLLFALGALGALACAREERWLLELRSWRETPHGFQIALPASLPREPQLVFRAYVGTFDILVNDQRIHAFDDPNADRTMRVHVVPLPHDAAGTRLTIRIARMGREPYLGGAPVVASRAQLPDALQRIALSPLRDDASDVTLGAILIVIGLISIAVSQLRRRGDTRALLLFGVFAALYGARLIFESHWPLALGLPVDVAHFGESWITYLIPIPGWMLARRFVGDGWMSTTRLQVGAFALFAPIAIASDLVTGRPGSLEGINNVLVIAGGINIVVNVILRRRTWSYELRVVLAASAVFMLFAVANNLAGLGIAPWEDVDETPGFIVFLSAIGFAATRDFLRSERDRAAIDSELATAREIQQSILPRAMPQVAGLRFDAHYDPASSVAGDLYDFLRVDEHRVGVLVADVSGHGVPAALIASMVKIAVSSQSRFAHDPATLLREVNRTLRGEVRRAFVTATYLVFERGSVEVANAGHPAPLLQRGNEVRELGRQGVLLGRFDTAYESETIELRRGDRVVAYTDGIIEARNARGEDFGEARLHDALRRGVDAAQIAGEVRQWRRDDADADDVTVVIVAVT